MAKKSTQKSEPKVETSQDEFTVVVQLNENDAQLLAALLARIGIQAGIIDNKGLRAHLGEKTKG